MRLRTLSHRKENLGCRSLSVSCGLTLAQGFTRSDTVSGWRTAAIAVPDDVPAVFALLGV